MVRDVTQTEDSFPWDTRIKRKKVKKKIPKGFNDAPPKKFPSLPRPLKTSSSSVKNLVKQLIEANVAIGKWYKWGLKVEEFIKTFARHGKDCIKNPCTCGFNKKLKDLDITIYSSDDEN